jgi:hypothetical protein
LPISREEFEKLKPMDPTLEEQVLNFLRKNPQFAYTPMEAALGIDPNALIRHPDADRVIHATLEGLRARKAVVGKFRDAHTGPEYYYAVVMRTR